jgi:hypothetical protein
MTNILSAPVPGSVVERAYGVVPPISGLSGRFDYPAIVGVYLDQANWLGTAWDRNGQIRTPASDAVSGLVIELLERGSIQSISHDYIAISVVRPSFYGAQQVAPNPLRAIAWRDSDGLKSQYFFEPRCQCGETRHLVSSYLVDRVSTPRGSYDVVVKRGYQEDIPSLRVEVSDSWWRENHFWISDLLPDQSDCCGLLLFVRRSMDGYAWKRADSDRFIAHASSVVTSQDITLGGGVNG